MDNLDAPWVPEGISEHDTIAVCSAVKGRSIKDAGSRFDKRLVAVGAIHVLAARVRLTEGVEHLKVLPRWRHPVQDP